MAVTRSSNRRDWSEMPYDLLLQIFAMINVLDRITNVAAVCKSWRFVISNETFSNTLDIAECRQHLKPKTPKRKAKRELELAFVRGINLGRINLTTLIFDPSFQPGDKHLRYATRRCPNLQKLVLPFPNSATGAWVEKAFEFWRNLECLHIPYHGFIPPVSFFVMVGLNCLNLRVLKVSCWAFAQRHIEAIANFMPSLNVLSVRCALLEADMIEAFSIGGNLEQVYLSILNLRSSRMLPNFNQLPSAVNDARNLKSLPSLQVFHVCSWEGCRNSCMAVTMGGPPMNIPDPLPWPTRSIGLHP